MTELKTEHSAETSRVMAIFHSRAAADEAAGDLLTTGFDPESIHLLDQEGTKRASGSPAGDKTISIPAFPVSATGDPTGVGTGAYFNAGTGGFDVGLAAFGLSQERAALFREHLDSGATLVVVDTTRRSEIAMLVLQRNGGEQVSSQS